MTNDEVRQAIKDKQRRANELTDEHDDVIAERDTLIRQALTLGVSAEDIAQDIQKGRARIYQIRDNRR